MSGNNYSCRDKYYNYGSYLRSRGFDKELCNLLEDIKSGISKIGSIQPGNCADGTPTIVTGDITIEPCENDTENSTGTLKIYGGNSSNPSIETTSGASFMGDVIIRGNLAVTGYVEDLSAVSVFEALEIETKSGFNGNSFVVFQSPDANGNMQEHWTDISSNISGTNAWKKDLVYAIDGPYNNVIDSDGATDTSGHVRGLRGATFMNPPSKGNAIDMVYEKNIANSDLALDVYGKVNVSKGNNGANAVIDIKKGFINTYDLSVNNYASIYDLSVVNLMTVGTSTTYINSEDVSANKMHAGEIYVKNLFVENDIGIKDLSINDLSVNNVNIYKDFLVSKNIVFDGEDEHKIAFNTGSSRSGRITNNGELNVSSTSGSMLISAAEDLDLESSQSIDLSANTISLNKNPEVQFSGVSDPFVIFGIAKTIMNMTHTTQVITPAKPLVLKASKPTYSNYPSGTFIVGNENININSAYFDNCIIEITVSLNCKFDPNADGLTCSLVNGSNTYEIDTRSIVKATTKNITFGPMSFYTSGSYSYLDKTSPINIGLELVGSTGTVNNISNTILTMTTTKYDA